MESMFDFSNIDLDHIKHCEESWYQHTKWMIENASNSIRNYCYVDYPAFTMLIWMFKSGIIQIHQYDKTGMSGDRSKYQMINALVQDVRTAMKNPNPKKSKKRTPKPEIIEQKIEPLPENARLFPRRSLH